MDRPKSLPTGLAVSIGLHALIIAFVAITFSHPQALAPPADLSNAIPISMEMFRPKPPPEPPKPVKPKTPKDVVTTKAPDAQTEAAAVEPPAEPSPPQESQPSAPGTASYASLVAGILQRNKQYPKEALRAHQTGTVQVYFVINHQGHVIAYRLDRRSGVMALDTEVAQLLKRVSFPPIPDDGGDPERREFNVPVVFELDF